MAGLTREGRRPGVPDAVEVPQQISLPNAEAAPAQPATGEVPAGAAASAPLPRPTTPPVRATKEAVVFTIKLNDPLAIALGLYAYLLPVALYAAWVSVSMWDLARRDGLSGQTRVGLAALVLAVPLVGPVGYLAFGARSVPRGLRWFLALGGLLLYALMAAISFSFGRA
jgi:hypothetical protein